MKTTKTPHPLNLTNVSVTINGTGPDGQPVAVRVPLVEFANDSDAQLVAVTATPDDPRSNVPLVSPIAGWYLYLNGKLVPADDGSVFTFTVGEAAEPDLRAVGELVLSELTPAPARPSSEAPHRWTYPGDWS